MKTVVQATVTVEVDVTCNSTWSGEATLNQVHQQALEDFNRAINNMRQPCIINDVKHQPLPIRIIGKPIVNMVITDGGK